MIVLVRHGHIDGSAGRCVGRCDIPLSSTGCKQADHLAAVLKDVWFARLCSSPSRRALQTIRPLASMTGMEPDIVPELDEIDMGTWEGLSFDEIRHLDPAAFEERGKCFGKYRVPGGESFDDVASRAMIALERIAAGPVPALVVTHAGIIRSVLCRLTGTPINELFQFRPDYLSCVVLEQSDGVLRLVGADLEPEDVPSFL